MTRTLAQSDSAARALALVESLQARFVTALSQLATDVGTPAAFDRVEWLRDDGRHGGGVRFAVADAGPYNRGSVNVSQVHYDDTPDKRLGSATAFSTIIHPADPRAPSVHIHVSWTELRDGSGYWRVMADLNPSIEIGEDREAFAAALRAAAPEPFEDATTQGDKYFWIPALDRHRGVIHFYLEAYATADPDADAQLARRVGETAIDTYVAILQTALDRVASPPSDADRRAQLAYHTLYLFQVLTLDRGTTSGLLVHDQNDLGIMGSLPSHVDRELLRSWAARVEPPQDVLVQRLADALPDAGPSLVGDEAKLALARGVREFYRQHPRALDLQASGNVAVPTVRNHQ